MKEKVNFANQVIEACDSTNTLAKQLGEAGYPHGTWVSAKKQTAGRGRLGRTWESSEGNLFLSILTRVPQQTLWSWIPLTAAVGICRYLRTEFNRIPTLIKWPNDLWVNDLKIGGLLCEGARAEHGAYIVIGIGLNCVHSPVFATNLKREGAEVSAEDVRLPIIESVLKEISILMSEGPDAIRMVYNQWAAMPPGARVQWGEENATGRSTGTVEGLGEYAELKVRDSISNLEKSLFADDVRVIRKASDGSLA